MRDVSPSTFLSIVAGQRGHFRLESGHHGSLWLDLDSLFANAERIEPFVAELSARIKPYNVAAVCGPLLGGAFLAQLVARDVGAEFCFTERTVPAARSGLFKARYRLPSAFSARVRGKRVALVDDVMSAGSALRGTYTELEAHGALPVVAGALLMLGTAGADYFAAHNVPVEAVARDEYELWVPAECPLCARGVPLTDPVLSSRAKGGI